MHFYFFFFFQAEDGIRDHCVTGVQTCALPISGAHWLKHETDLADLLEKGCIGTRLVLPGDDIRIEEIPLGTRAYACANLGAGLDKTLRSKHFECFTQDGPTDIELKT